jgi:hypothetical protein
MAVYPDISPRYSTAILSFKGVRSQLIGGAEDPLPPRFNHQRRSARHDLVRMLALLGEHVTALDKHKANTFDCMHMIVKRGALDRASTPSDQRKILIAKDRFRKFGPFSALAAVF